MKRPGPQVCRYAADRPIRIGSANTDDITVKEKGIGPHRFQVDPLQKMIEDRGSGMQGLLNQEKFSGKVSFKDWDLFSIGPLKIVLERNALWILSNEKVIVHLPKTSAVSDYTLQFPPLRSMRLHAQMVRERPPQKLSASVPVRRQPTLRKPHFAEYLPSLMMSLAAAVSVLSSWFTNPDMPITAWVMPLCMLGVHLMLFPLRRLAYRQEAKRQKEAEDRRIEQLRKQEIMRIKEFKEAHTAWNDAYFPNALQLERFLNSSRIGTRDRDSYAGNRICLGEAQGLLMVQLSHGAEDDAESLRILSEACADMQRQKSSWILDLAEYRRIRIRTTDLQKAFCRYLILQAALYFHPSEYVFVFSFGRSADLEEFRGLLQVYGEKERRWLISTARMRPRQSACLQRKKGLSSCLRKPDGNMGYASVPIQRFFWKRKCRDTAEKRILILQSILSHRMQKTISAIQRESFIVNCLNTVRKYSKTAFPGCIWKDINSRINHICSIWKLAAYP